MKAIEFNVLADGLLLCFDDSTQLCRNRGLQKFVVYFDDISEWSIDGCKTYILFNDVDVELNIDSNINYVCGTVPDKAYLGDTIQVQLFLIGEDIEIISSPIELSIHKNRVRRNINIDYQALYDDILKQHTRLEKQMTKLNEENDRLKSEINTSNIKIKYLNRIIGRQYKTLCDTLKELNKQYTRSIKHKRYIKQHINK